MVTERTPQPQWPGPDVLASRLFAVTSCSDRKGRELQDLDLGFRAWELGLGFPKP